MNIAIVNAVFPPEPVVSARLGADIARHISELGHNVTVFCPAPSRPAGSRYQALCDSGYGFRVIRVDSFLAPQSRLAARLIESYSFGRHVCRALARSSSSYDVVYANSWPILSPAILAKYCSKNGIPVVYHIQDLYPEALIGRLPFGLRRILVQPLMALEKRTVACVEHVVVAGDAMQRVFAAGTRGKYLPPVTTIHNWQDERRFGVAVNRRVACERYGVDSHRRTFMFLGNIGPVADFERVIDAFAAANLEGAQLVVVGEGSQKTACMARAARHQAAKILFRSDPDPDNVPAIQSMADVCVLPMRSDSGVSSVPSKLIAYMLSAKPVLGIIEGTNDTTEFITKSGGGWLVSPANESDVAAAFRATAKIPDSELVRLGKLGEEFAIRHFSRTKCLGELSDIILNAANRRRRLRAHE